MASLDHGEIQRYARHLILPEIGMQGQQKLKDASVLLVGTGGLGSPAAMYLAAAGIGHLGLVDFDVVEASNLQRQIVHGEATLGIKKVESAKARLLDLNPCVSVTTYDTRLSSDNAREIFAGYDVVADGTDNFPTRYLVNDACTLLGIPNVYASIFRFEGQLSVFDARHGPCYRCLYAEPPPPGLVPSCAEGGVLGILPGVLGVLQATEVVKTILDLGDRMIGRLLLFDALAMRFRELKLRKDPQCVLCGEHPSVTELIDYQQFCGIPASGGAPAPDAGGGDSEIAPTALQRRQQQTPPLLLVDVREPHEWDIARIEGAVLIPLGQLQKRLDEIPKTNEVVLYCKGGVRSLKALKVLKDAGYQNAVSLKGGINAWSREVDAGVPLY